MGDNDALRAHPDEIAGISGVYRDIGTDLTSIAGYINNHGTPSNKMMGEIIAAIVPAVTNLRDSANQSTKNYSSAAEGTAINLNRAAWMYHDTDQRNYAALNSHTISIAGRESDSSIAGQGITENYPNPVSYTGPEGIILPPPDGLEENLVKAIEDKTGWLGDFNEGIRLATDDKWSPLGQLFEPLEGNWNEFRRLGGAYRAYGNAMEASSKNVSWSALQLGNFWDGKAAIAFENYAQDLSRSIQWWGPVGRSVDHVFTIIAEEVTKGCLAIAMKLKDMLEKEVDVTDGKNVVKIALKKVPVLGTTWQLVSLGNICLQVWNTIKPILDKIRDLIKSAKNLLEKISSKDKPKSEMGQVNETISSFTDDLVDAHKVAVISNELNQVWENSDSQNGDQTRKFNVGAGANPWEGN
ncbi:type VII secretion target [Nocardia salmonicida]|uniref:type VII secretion target n=1 Tax=Nocardia salmonicida TaxID=53431 RepID=UPI0009EF16C2|nr:type VII secretion target [Nocardia salmonicida]